VPPAAAGLGAVAATGDEAGVTPAVKELFKRAMTVNLQSEATNITLHVAGRPVPMPPVAHVAHKHGRPHKKMAAEAPGPEVSLSIQFHSAGRPVPPEPRLAKATGASPWHLEAGSPIDGSPETELHPIDGSRHEASMWLAGDEGQAWAQDALALKLICFSERRTQV
jgi:hypothetical protein